MQSENSTREEDLLPFGAPQADTVDPSVRAKLAQATSGNQKIQRSPRALRPLWNSIPILVIALAASAYLIGMTLWSRSSLAHWTNGEYPAAQAGYEGQMAWTSVGVERWVAHYNLGTTLVRQDAVDDGVNELRTAYDLVPKAVEVQPGRLEPYSYECRVRVNLGIGIEIQADALREGGSLDDAINSYQEAEDLISPCQTAGGGGGSQSNQSGDQGQSGGQGQSGDSDNPANENKNRVQQKKQDTEQEKNGEDPNQQNKDPQNGTNNNEPEPSQSPTSSPSASPTPDPYAGENEEQKQRRQDLQNQNGEREQKRRDQDDSKRSGNPNGAW
ncbi:MAG: hypothetical protein HXK09_03455 [Actinomyces bouchesdurhonensis]|uniref:Tetratricopeptide repeat protein n=1 Tax=Actinomyces bouchesdurhonensis TaxID=1852361 RepID=A0A929WVJ7_9ACTO|nr:hypothetical protein [Actinomyces bouchesdurhonensis]